MIVVVVCFQCSQIWYLWVWYFAWFELYPSMHCWSVHWIEAYKTFVYTSFEDCCHGQNNFLWRYVLRLRVKLLYQEGKRHTGIRANHHCCCSPHQFYYFIGGEMFINNNQFVCTACFYPICYRMVPLWISFLVKTSIFTYEENNWLPCA